MVEESAVPDLLRAWLTRAFELGASDLHLVVGYPPVIRLHGDLTELDATVLDEEQANAILRGLCFAEVLAQFQAKKNVDFSFTLLLNGQAIRFRANLFHSNRQVGACIRLVPTAIPEFEWAGFPIDLAERLASLQDGLVIVTGATGSGKTTTLAMIVNLLNQTGSYRIITVEDPIEYRFPKASNSMVTQREVGTDVHTFADGLRF